MTLLAGIWWASWFLGALSILMMGSLIIKRLWSDHRDRILAARRAELEAIVIQALDDPKLLYEHQFSDQDAGLVGDIVRGLYSVIRGDTRSDLVHILKDLGVDEVFLKQLASGKDKGRLQAIANLSMFESEEVKKALWQALNDRSQQIRMAAAKALVASPYAFSILAMIEKLEVGTVVKTRELRTLFKDLAKRDAPSMTEILAADVNDLVKVLAIHALGRAGDYSVLPAILPLADHQSIDVRAETFRTFATMQHPDAIPLVLNGLQDTAWEVRTQAAIAAGRIGIEESVPLLAALLDDTTWWVRYRAARALAELGSVGLEELRRIACVDSEAGHFAELVLAERKAA